MVTKQPGFFVSFCFGSVLAKILMVTKQGFRHSMPFPCSVLAKILMVTKLSLFEWDELSGSVLAKILMVTKLIVLAMLLT